MTNPARAAILGNIRRSLHRASVEAPPHGLGAVIPARGQGGRAERVERFIAMVVETQASLDRVASLATAPAALARFLDAVQLPPRIVAAPALSGLDWAGLEVRFGAAQAGDLVSVTPCLRGVAETGTLVAASGPDHPQTLNFLPDLHVVVLTTDQVVGSYEEAMAALPPAMPRTVTWITGPSRTADIEQSLLLGAHGPRRLHVVLADGP